MGVLDKIKNALFEVEYVEVDELEKKEKKSRNKEKTKTSEKDSSSKPIAKKVVLPGKKNEKVEELKEEELNDENFEIRPKDEVIKEDFEDNFKFMDDGDFKVDDEPEILEIFPSDEEIPKSRVKKRQEQDIYSNDYDKQQEEKRIDEPVVDNYYQKSQSKKLYSSSYDSKPYGMDNSYDVPMHEYGSDEKREEKNYFKPSPIISPIYGILDKNYKKEDVVQKKEIRLTTNFSRSNVSVDDIRNKAYGEKEIVEDNISTFEVEEEEENENLLVDLSDEKGKPEVKELTMGDALEYFQDLGLEYNVDYVDASKERTTPKREKDNYDDSLQEDNDESLVVLDEVSSDDEEKSPSIVQIEDESNNDEDSVDDDNLFDLIDSMYQEKD